MALPRFDMSRYQGDRREEIEAALPKRTSLHPYRSDPDVDVIARALILGAGMTGEPEYSIIVGGKDGNQEVVAAVAGHKVVVNAGHGISHSLQSRLGMRTTCAIHVAHPAYPTGE